MSDDFESDESANEPAAAPEVVVKLVPTIDYFQKNYGRSLEGNDQKAVRVFRDYEPNERLRRLQNELQQVKDKKVSENVLHAVVGKKRMHKYQGYDRWASLMLMWIVSKK
ncbi:MAG: hypothetical protein IT290_04470 [Deltaproteobacteria bacterium]|nr:hypothetical protein [Deltaproteobacteria bacterium]